LTTIDLCLSLFLGAVSHDQVGGEDAYAARSARQYSQLIHISDGKLGDVNVLDIGAGARGDLHHGSSIWISPVFM
jgi:hypothetical protein